MTIESLIAEIRAGVIGDGFVLAGPYGLRPVVYADYTASGRSLDFIEDFIRDAVLPLYANTHTESSATGRHTSALREQARELIGRSLGASDEHAVLFCGSGATGAVDKLIGVLGLRLPSTLDDRYGFRDRIPMNERPVVFVGPFEHHSNELPWRETIADVVVIGEDEQGGIDLEQLRRELERHSDRELRIGSFSAASNVTGILADVDSIASLLHEHDALSFWDYAAAAPYVPVDLGSSADGKNTYLDAVFLSPHKMIGGPGTPGLLVARRELFTNRVPDVVGGGTVSYVTGDDHRYLSDIEQREEGGTPAIIGSIRAGLVFRLRDVVGTDEIRARENEFARRASAAWDDHPNLRVLGNREVDRLSIVSFVICHGERLLHHNFVVAVLNDLFGIQSRGGCSCAGPYGHRLLDIDAPRSGLLRHEIERGVEGLKPGWARVNFNYFIDEDTFDYIIEAVKLVADNGWRLLPEYDFDLSTGLWQHRDSTPSNGINLCSIDFTSGSTQRNFGQPVPCDSLADQLNTARRVFHAAPITAGPDVVLDADDEALRWFALASDPTPESAPYS